MSTYNTKIGEFCATYKNWEELLAEEPYSILVKRKDGFVIFNYRQLSSDFNNEIVRECRGIIFKEGEWEYPVCHAFDKFFNYGQHECAELDWSTVKVSEKIDGSIMRLWNYAGEWHVSTNGNIDAKDATVPDIRKDNFEELFWEGVSKNIRNTVCSYTVAGWLRSLNPERTYIFEMVSPYTRVVIPYKETNVFFLGARHNELNIQYGCDDYAAYSMNTQMFPRPRIYEINTLEDIINTANELPWDSEGYVCYDRYFNRCKIKSPKYVIILVTLTNLLVPQLRLH